MLTRDYNRLRAEHLSLENLKSGNAPELLLFLPKMNSYSVAQAMLSCLCLLCSRVTDVSHHFW